MKEERTIEDLSMDGGVLCLDFINTVHDYTDSTPYDYLQTREDWLDWLSRADVVSRKRLESWRNMPPEENERAERMKLIYQTRNTLYRLFRSTARDTSPEPVILQRFNRILSKALSRIRLKSGGGGFEVTWNWEENPEEVPLAMIVKSAYDLITEKTPERIKECEMCGWLFYDRSKNRSRRWCNMQACGSQYKSRKYYHRMKKQKQE